MKSRRKQTDDGLDADSDVVAQSCFLDAVLGNAGMIKSRGVKVRAADGNDENDEDDDGTKTGAMTKASRLLNGCAEPTKRTKLTRTASSDRATGPATRAEDTTSDAILGLPAAFSRSNRKGTSCASAAIALKDKQKNATLTCQAIQLLDAASDKQFFNLVKASAINKLVCDMQGQLTPEKTNCLRAADPDLSWADDSVNQLNVYKLRLTLLMKVFVSYRPEKGTALSSAQTLRIHIDNAVRANVVIHQGCRAEVPLRRVQELLRDHCGNEDVNRLIDACLTLSPTYSTASLVPNVEADPHDQLDLVDDAAKGSHDHVALSPSSAAQHQNAVAAPAGIADDGSCETVSLPEAAAQHDEVVAEPAASAVVALCEEVAAPGGQVDACAASSTPEAEPVASAQASTFDDLHVARVGESASTLALLQDESAKWALTGIKSEPLLEVHHVALLLKAFSIIISHPRTDNDQLLCKFVATGCSGCWGSTDGNLQSEFDDINLFINRTQDPPDGVAVLNAARLRAVDVGNRVYGPFSIYRADVLALVDDRIVSFHGDKKVKDKLTALGRRVGTGIPIDATSLNSHGYNNNPALPLGVAGKLFEDYQETLATCSEKLKTDCMSDINDIAVYFHNIRDTIVEHTLGNYRAQLLGFLIELKQFVSGKPFAPCTTADEANTLTSLKTAWQTASDSVSTIETCKLIIFGESQVTTTFAATVKERRKYVDGLMSQLKFLVRRWALLNPSPKRKGNDLELSKSVSEAEFVGLCVRLVEFTPGASKDEQNCAVAQAMGFKTASADYMTTLPSNPIYMAA
jgi:hypothetical protein